LRRSVKTLTCVMGWLRPSPRVTLRRSEERRVHRDQRGHVAFRVIKVHQGQRVLKEH
jgi:hypothetical protein